MRSKVEAPSRLPVRGNRELVSQALANLVDNAIKYGAPAATAGRRVATIVVDSAERGGSGLADGRRSAGRAFREAMRQRVVERFVRLEQSRSRAGLRAWA